MNDKQQTFIFFTVLLAVSILTLFVEDENVKVLESLYKKCEYQKVINLADEILAENKLEENEKARVIILKGVSEFSLHQTLNSQMTFLQLLENYKNIELNEQEVSPKIITLVNKLKSNFKEQP